MQDMHRSKNSVMEIQDVVRGLVEKPTLKRQAAVLQKYFTEDVEFRHFYINTGGVQDLTAIYQMAELVVNYQSLEFENIIYDSRENAMAIKMTVMVKPLYILPQVPLRLCTLLEFQDEKVQGGPTLKKIMVQRDYFERSPILIFIPILGRIYDSNSI
uniref:SigF-like NTF2-like domain-containing protein n=1 Tax=Physcomitrium patens TaxID=3218 RepID=A0A2K1ICC2_PHYPA|nr:hypothetical protein PHYPA_030387 [Physcomitrium patens]